MLCIQCILKSDVLIFYIVNRCTKNTQIKFYVLINNVSGQGAMIILLLNIHMTVFSLLL